MQILAKTYTSLSLPHSGYIAGSGDGIVTVRGVPSSRKLWLLDATTMLVEQANTSLNNGHYMFLGLNPLQKYVVIVRDFEPDGIRWTGEAAIWDYVEPATDLTLDDQLGLFLSWQTI